MIVRAEWFEHGRLVSGTVEVSEADGEAPDCSCTRCPECRDREAAERFIRAQAREEGGP